MTVEWVPRALDLLARIWVEASVADREVIAREVDTINARLAHDPWSVGESRGKNSRVWFVVSLVVGYQILRGGKVEVLHVARLRGRSQPEAED